MHEIVLSKIMDPETAIIGTAAWFGNKLLGPTLGAIGEDIKKLYQKGINKITEKAMKKTSNLEEPGKTNLRVTRDVFFNGAFADEEICAEYFGGILASSRNKDGKDDSGIFFLDIIKSLSAEQLRIHYVIYRTLNKLWFDQKKKIKMGVEDKLMDEKLFLPLRSIVKEFPVNRSIFSVVLYGLQSKNLISGFEINKHQLHDSRNMPYLCVQPTSIGIQLFAIANNKLQNWERFPSVDFGDFDNIVLPQYYAQSLNVLLEKTGLQ